MIFLIPNRWSERFDKNCYDTQVSTLNRVELYKKSLLVIVHNPLGVGAGKFSFELDKLEPKFLNDEGFSTCLNSYLTLCSEFGIQTLLVFLILIFYLMLKSLRNIGRDYIKLGLLACVISLLIFGLFTSNINRVYFQFLIFSSYILIIFPNVIGSGDHKYK